MAVWTLALYPAWGKGALQGILDFAQTVYKNSEKRGKMRVEEEKGGVRL